MFVGSIDNDRLRSLLDSEEACVQALYDAKWPDGYRCPRCEHPHAYVISTRRFPLFECRNCKKQTSLIVDTVFQGTRTPLHLWFQAIYLHSRPEGINALRLAETIGVTYKTSWLICHKLRTAMSHAEASRLLEGLVRVTDTTIYYRLAGISNWQPQEQSVLIAASAGEIGYLERIKIERQDKNLLKNRLTSPSAASFVLRHVAPEAWNDLTITRRRKEHDRALLSVGEALDNWLAWLFRGVGPKHLQAYITHFCYWWNERNRSMFEDLLKWCAATPRTTYRELTGRAAGRSSRPVRSANPASRVVAG
ncbi:transposase [Cohnella zeiphila]|nr:transposase [Cohnella zeiphila]